MMTKRADSAEAGCASSCATSSCCAIPQRSWLDVPNDAGARIAVRCASLASIRTWTVGIVLALALGVAAWMVSLFPTEVDGSGAVFRNVFIPAWAPLIPLAWAAIATWGARERALSRWRAEEAAYRMSGMAKREWLSMQTGGERSDAGLWVTILTTMALVLGGLLGPWLRADNRA